MTTAASTPALRRLAGLLPWVLLALTGCASDTWKLTPPWKRADLAAKADAAPQDSLVLRGGGLQQAGAVDATPAPPDLEAARRHFQNKEYDKAEPLFRKVATANARTFRSYFFDDDGNIASEKVTDEKRPRAASDAAIEEACFYEAECQRLQKNYRAAADSYGKLVHNFRYSQYTERVNRGLFEIADHWLAETRRQMDEYHEKLEGKRWFVTPASFVHVSTEYPVTDTEGHAVRVLEMIRLNDINGPLGERALFYLGTVKFFRRDYQEADLYFSQLYQQYPNSEFAPKAIKQAVICKQLCTGGTEYDCRTVEESKKLLHVAQTAYPELAKDEKWIGQQLVGINLQQADRDWKIAEFYRRTGHPGSAYFYYELVERRYPRTTYADKAGERKRELQGQVAKERGKDAAAPAQPPAQQAPNQLPLMQNNLIPNLGLPEESTAPR